MKIVTWNVNGIRARFDEVVQLCRDEEPDALCLQEIKAEASQVPEPLTGLPAYHSLWHGGPKGYSGVSIHMRRDRFARAQFSSPSFDIEHRIVEARADDFSIACVYVPNGGKDYSLKTRFLDDLIAHAKGDDRPMILCGDLNVTRGDIDLHETHRKRGAIGQRKEERSRIEALMKAGGWADTLRERSPDDDTIFTWWPPWREEKAKNRGWRIDYVLLPEDRLPKVTRCEVLRSYGTSDHAPLVVEVSP